VPLPCLRRLLFTQHAQRELLALHLLAPRRLGQLRQLPAQRRVGAQQLGVGRGELLDPNPKIDQFALGAVEGVAVPVPLSRPQILGVAHRRVHRGAHLAPHRLPNGPELEKPRPGSPTHGATVVSTHPAPATAAPGSPTAMW
jgi:hypothetical protein